MGKRFTGSPLEPMCRRFVKQWGETTAEGTSVETFLGNSGACMGEQVTSDGDTQTARKKTWTGDQGTFLVWNQVKPVQCAAAIAIRPCNSTNKLHQLRAGGLSTKVDLLLTGFVLLLVPCRFATLFLQQTPSPGTSLRNAALLCPVFQSPGFVWALAAADCFLCRLLLSKTCSCFTIFPA